MLCLGLELPDGEVLRAIVDVKRPPCCSLVRLKLALAKKAPAASSNIGVGFSVVGHMDKRERSSCFRFDFHDELHEHVGVEGIEKIHVRERI